VKKELLLLRTTNQSLVADLAAFKEQPNPELDTLKEKLKLLQAANRNLIANFASITIAIGDYPERELRRIVCDLVGDGLSPENLEELDQTLESESWRGVLGERVERPER
jgi:hypothetical protein